VKKRILSISILLNLILCISLCTVAYKTNLIAILLNRNADKTFNPQYEQRLTSFEDVKTTHADVVFLGDSLTERGLWNELFPDISTANRGIGSDTSTGVLYRIDNVIKLKPKKLFLMIGVNDISLKMEQQETLENYSKIIDKITKELPNTQLYIQSVLPVRKDYTVVSNNDINNLNAALTKLAKENNITYIDINNKLKDYDNALKPDYTEDGIHLKGDAYTIWFNQIKNYVY
jgi:lysophospholipase L1-like esterase